jgi:hypothetical protein
MTRCESYPLCSGTIYFPTAPFASVWESLYIRLETNNKTTYHVGGHMQWMPFMFLAEK